MEKESMEFNVLIEQDEDGIYIAKEFIEAVKKEVK